MGFVRLILVGVFTGIYVRKLSIISKIIYISFFILYTIHFKQQYFFNSLFYGFEMQISKFIEFHFLSLSKKSSFQTNL